MTDLRRRLAAASRRILAPGTSFAPEPISHWLEACQRAVVDEAVVMYARSMAGTGADLDTDLEIAALEPLEKSDESE